MATAGHGERRRTAGGGQRGELCWLQRSWQQLLPSRLPGCLTLPAPGSPHCILPSSLLAACSWQPSLHFAQLPAGCCLVQVEQGRFLVQPFSMLGAGASRSYHRRGTLGSAGASGGGMTPLLCSPRSQSAAGDEGALAAGQLPGGEGWGTHRCWEGWGWGRRYPWWWQGSCLAGREGCGSNRRRPTWDHRSALPLPTLCRHGVRCSPGCGLGRQPHPAAGPPGHAATQVLERAACGGARCSLQGAACHSVIQSSCHSVTHCQQAACTPPAVRRPRAACLLSTACRLPCTQHAVPAKLTSAGAGRHIPARQAQSGCWHPAVPAGEWEPLGS